MEAVGEFYEQSTDVELHGVEHLTEIVDLKRVDIFLFFLLCDHIYEKSDIVAEFAADIVDCVVCVLDNVVQKGRHHHVRTQCEFFSCNSGHGYGMQYVRLARLSLLGRVRLARQLESLAD